MASSVVKAEEEREGLRGLGNLAFAGVLILAALAIFGIARWIGQSYAFFAAYVVAQYIVLGTAWNILGGYTGYVNFGITAFFALGAYSSVVWHKLTPWMPLPVMVLIGGPLLAGWMLLRRRRGKLPMTLPAAAVVLVTLAAWTVVRNLPGFPLVPTLLTH